MSVQLLDLAIQEAIADHPLPPDHFLAQLSNVAAAKAMIAGDSSGVAAGKTWLYGIVNNAESGAHCLVSFTPLHAIAQHSRASPCRDSASTVGPLWAR